jgi:hypothetical protein
MKSNNNVWNKPLTALFAFLVLLSTSVTALTASTKHLGGGEFTGTTSTSYQNAGEDDFGGKGVGDEQSIAIKLTAYENETKYEDGNLSGKQTTKVELEGKGTWDESGGMLEVKAGLEAVVEGAVKGELGSDNLGLSGEVAGKLEAALKGEGLIGAYVDDKGLTIGAKGELGATLGAEISTTATVTVLGIDTSVKLVATGQVGASVEGAAIITIGKDGKIKFAIGGGATLGIGGNVRMEFEVSADKLIAKLGLKDVSELIEWIMKVSTNSKELMKELFGDEDNIMVDLAKIMETLETIGKIKDTLAGWLPGVDDPNPGASTGPATGGNSQQPVSTRPIKISP